MLKEQLEKAKKHRVDLETKVGGVASVARHEH